MRVLTVPGYTNSGPEHWQTRWEAEHPEVKRVVQRDWDRPDWPDQVVGFRPMPLAPMALESTVVAGRNDPWVSVARARVFAEAWGSRFADAGPAGHLDSSSGLGDWPAGWRLLEELLTRRT